MTLLALGSAWHLGPDEPQSEARAERRLEDAEIEERLREAFAAHRCVVKFEKDDRGVRQRVSLTVYVSRVRAHLLEQEVSVEGVSVPSLRSREALNGLIRDVQEQVRLCKGGRRAGRTRAK